MRPLEEVIEGMKHCNPGCQCQGCPYAEEEGFECFDQVRYEHPLHYLELFREIMKKVNNVNDDR